MNQKQNRGNSYGNNSSPNSFIPQNNGSANNPQYKEVVNFPVYFFKPVEIDGKIWVPQPVCLDMPGQEQSTWRPPTVPPVQPMPPVMPPMQRPQESQAVASRGNIPQTAKREPVNFNNTSPTYKAPSTSGETFSKTKKTAKPKKQRGRLNKFLIVLLWIALALMLAFEITSILSRPNGSDSLPMPFGYALVTENSNNMSPAINRGDVGLVIPNDHYSRDSLVVFINDSNDIVVSRYLGVDTNGMARTIADNSTTVDKPVDWNNIKGEIKFIFPQGSVFLNCFGDIALIVIIVILLIVCYKWKPKKKHT